MKRSHYSEALDRTEVLAKLAAFDPHVVGTPPLGLNLPTSDIDVICFAPDSDAFTCAVWDAFGTRSEFRVWQKVGADRPIVASFSDEGWTIEVFGQTLSIAEQHGWRHFVLEQRLLALGGEALHCAVMNQRASGMKTESAFAVVLDLSGDPYQALLSHEHSSDVELAALLRDQDLL